MASGAVEGRKEGRRRRKGGVERWVKTSRIGSHPRSLGLIKIRPDDYYGRLLLLLRR